MWLFLLVAFFDFSFACLTSSNPQTLDNSVTTCPCTLGTDVQPLCPTYPVQSGLATFTVTLRTANQPATDPLCTLSFSGCNQYRIYYADHCEKDGNPGNPAEGHGPLICSGGPDFADTLGNVYKAVDCQS